MIVGLRALHLGRFVRWLAKIEVQLQAGLVPTEQLCHIAYSAGNVVFKNSLFDPSVSAEEFARRQAEEFRRDAMSEKERERELDEIVERLRSGAFDDSADTWLSPVKDRERVVEFVGLSHTLLKPLADFVTPADSLLEDLVVRHVNGPRARRDLGGIYGMLAAWDLMRMQQEGRPPYSIRFAPGFANSLRQVITDEEGEEPPAAEVEEILREMSQPREYCMYEALRGGGVQIAVGPGADGLFHNVIVHRVEHLAAVDAPGGVPEKAIVGRGEIHLRQGEVIAASQKAEIF